MKTIIILAHPNIEQSTINKAWMEAAIKNKVTVHNIYQAYPDGQIDVEKEQHLLEEQDRIIFQYPFYWYNMPPLLKKWFDDVFSYGWAYGSAGSKLAGKELGVAISTGGAASAYTEEGSGTIVELLKPLESTAKFVSAQYIQSHVFQGALSPDAAERLPENVASYINYLTRK